MSAAVASIALGLVVTRRFQADPHPPSSVVVSAAVPVVASVLVPVAEIEDVSPQAIPVAHTSSRVLPRSEAGRSIAAAPPPAVIPTARVNPSNVF